MTITREHARQVEFAKYHRAYGQPAGYRMGKKRMLASIEDLRAVDHRGSYLDVSCGQGDMLDAAVKLGFARVRGTEIIPAMINDRVEYAEVHELPFADGSFEVVSMFDVIEHLVRPDDEAACKELKRVATKTVLITANNGSSRNQAGDELHINIRPYKQWHECFVAWFAPWKVTWLKAKGRKSECWRIDS